MTFSTCDVCGNESSAPPGDPCNMWGTARDGRGSWSACLGTYRERKVMNVTEKTVAHCFTYHPPTTEQTNSYADINLMARQLARTLLRHCPPSRELSLALTKVQEARMWGNASIAINPPVEHVAAPDPIAVPGCPPPGTGPGVVAEADRSE